MSSDALLMESVRDLGKSGDRTFNKVIFRIVPLFFLGFFISYLDRVNVGFAKLQMATDIGMSDAVFGVGASVFFWAYMLFEIPSNLIMHRVGAKIWIARIMITWGIVSMLMVYSSNATLFYVLRFLLGVCEAGFVPGVMYYTNNWLPTRRQSGMYSLFLMALPVSLIIGGPISGFILDNMKGVMGYGGWQWLFLMEGLPACILGVAVFLLLNNRIEDASWLSDEEKSFLRASLTDEARHKMTGIWSMVRNPHIYMLVVTMILFNSGFYGLSFWLPTIFKNAGITSNFHIGLLTAIPFVTAAIAMRLNALHSEKTNERRFHACIPALIAGLALIAATAINGGIVCSVVLLSIAAAGILSLMPVFWTMPGKFLQGPAAAAGLALINSMGSFSGILGTTVIGYLGATVGMYLFGGFLLVFSVLFFFVSGSVLRRYEAASQAV